MDSKDSRFKKDQGDEGEEIAVGFLQKKGYKIIQRNFRSGSLELDIIAEKEKVLIFVEVRLRANSKYGYPEELMSKGKINAVKRGAEAYIYLKKWDGEIRFDFISIIQFPNLEIQHFEDAYY